MHKFSGKRRSGFVVGYSQQAGGGWSGDLIIADWEEIENAETASEIYTKRFKAKEVTIVKRRATSSSQVIHYLISKGAESNTKKKTWPKHQLKKIQRQLTSQKLTTNQFFGL